MRPSLLPPTEGFILGEASHVRYEMSSSMTLSLKRHRSVPMPPPNKSLKLTDCQQSCHSLQRDASTAWLSSIFLKIMLNACARRGSIPALGAFVEGGFQHFADAALIGSRLSYLW